MVEIRRAKPEFKAWSVADEIKRQFFDNYLETQKHYIAYNLKKSKPKRRRFVARVIALAIDLYPKIGKLDEKRQSKFKPLYSLSSRFKSMSFQEAEKYFFLERELLELNGITLYESYVSPTSNILAEALTGKNQVGIR